MDNICKVCNRTHTTPELSKECSKVCLLFKKPVEMTSKTISKQNSSMHSKFYALLNQFAQDNELGESPFLIFGTEDNTLVILYTKVADKVAPDFVINMWNQIGFCFESIANKTIIGGNPLLYFVDCNKLDLFCSHFEKTMSRSYHTQTKMSLPH